MDEPDKSLAVGRGLRAKECAFWKEYLPNLVEKTGDFILVSVYS